MAGGTTARGRRDHSGGARRAVDGRGARRGRDVCRDGPARLPAGDTAEVHAATTSPHSQKKPGGWPIQPRPLNAVVGVTAVA
eukprot:2407412-Prymnesium_polylepis.1